MSSNVGYLNSWLNCSDDQLRFHFRIQDRLNEEKARFWHDIGHVNDYQKWLCYNRWVNENRGRLKLVDDNHNLDGYIE